MRFNHLVFNTLGEPGQLVADDERFFIGTNAHDASDRIIYNANTGALYFDADGDGAGGSVQLAILAGQTNLSASDIWVI